MQGAVLIDAGGVYLKFYGIFLEYKVRLSCHWWSIWVWSGNWHSNVIKIMPYQWRQLTYSYLACSWCWRDSVVTFVAVSILIMIVIDIIDADVSGDKNKDDAVEDEVQGFLFSRLKWASFLGFLSHCCHADIYCFCWLSVCLYIYWLC